jgi:hypothetical protein
MFGVLLWLSSAVMVGIEGCGFEQELIVSLSLEACMVTNTLRCSVIYMSNWLGY